MKLKVLTAAILAATLIGCSDDDDDDPIVDPDNGNGSASVINLDNVQKVLNTNADIALAAYEDSVDTAKTLQTAIATFAGEPTQANLDAAKSAWLAAREPYGQTEVYRFRLSPIDSTDYTNEDGPEGDINAWPLGEALIDYVVEGNDFGDDQVAVTEHATGVNYPAMNIINSDVEITKELISNTATAEDEKDVIAGYHAIEFMLWGQDLNLDGSADTLEARDSSGGQRPLTDFTSDQYAARRLQFMAVVAEKLIEDLESVRDGWAEGAAYRAAFTSAPDEATAKQKLAEILTGMGTLSEGELAGERMQIAFSANSQEDEHSCFSDNTHRDIWLNAEGVANSYYGVYAGYDSDDDGTDDMTARAVDGYGIDDYLTDAGLDAVKAEMEAALAETETQYMAIDQSARAGTPVDNLIQTAVRNADNPMYKGILALNAQSTVIANIATALTIDGDVVDPDASVCDTTDPATECEE
jgi:putative iron-regulated protein